MAQGDSIGRRTLLIYALPAFALAMPTIPAYVYLPTFYAETLGLGLAGAVLLVARGLDVITDPLIGIASDRLPTRWGRRKPWIVAGALLAAVALIQLFQPPDDVGPAHLLVWSVALYFGWTLIAVPYAAWGAELSPTTTTAPASPAPARRRWCWGWSRPAGCRRCSPISGRARRPDLPPLPGWRSPSGHRRSCCLSGG